MAATTRRLILFTRYPEPGTTKTRLAPALGSMGAADLQRRMTEHTMDVARLAACDPQTEMEIRFEGGTEGLVREWLGGNVRISPQGDGDLGERMLRAFKESADSGNRATVIIGSDCPALTPAIVGDAFRRLEAADIVLGPASDGGYYLIGLRRPAPELFGGMEWGTADVLRATLEKAEKAGLSSQLLVELTDVDRPEDLPAWHDVAGDGISVIIPALNEEQNIVAAIESARVGCDEVIVADGGSSDRTVEIAADHGATIVSSTGGRAAQMNAGASLAGSAILVFLHADTLLPEGYDRQVRDVLSRPGISVGAFRIRIDGDQPGLNLIQSMVNIRTALLRRPYGDQALFLTAEMFGKMGGYRDLPIMEDYDLLVRARKCGRVGIARGSVLTSGRRWRKLGLLRTTCVNQVMIIGYCLGVSPAKLAHFYRKEMSA